MLIIVFAVQASPPPLVSWPAFVPGAMSLAAATNELRGEFWLVLQGDSWRLQLVAVLGEKIQVGLVKRFLILIAVQQL